LSRTPLPGAPAGYRATWVEVDLDRIAANFAALRALAGRQSVVLPVVKANAYGHGATPVARRLEAEGVAGLCVAVPEEGLELRRAGIGAPLLCLGAVEPHQVAASARSRITLTLYSPEQLGLFEEIGRGAGIPIHFHLKVDTGMSRLGLLPGEIGPLLDQLRSCRSAILSGLYSNLASADSPGETSNQDQTARLNEAAEAIRGAGHDPRPVHLANSAGLLFHPALRLDAVRPGLLLYGIPPGPSSPAPGFAPALTLKTSVLRVKEVPPGTSVGYGGSWRASRPTTLATLAIGYDDGLSRALSDRGSVLIRGAKVPLVGLVSMDLAVADATAAGPVAPGDEVVLIGTQGEASIGAWEMAERAATIPWEILCRLGRRVPRVHFAGRTIVSVAASLPVVKEIAPAPAPSKGSSRASHAAAPPDRADTADPIEESQPPED
jgi:alanine racemase